MQRFAILGSHPELSLAEIRAITGATASQSAGITAVFDDMADEPTTLMQRLGGTQKIGHVIGELPTMQGDDADAMIEFLASQLEHEHKESKMHFGISVYDFGDTEAVEALGAQARRIGLSVKNALKARGVSSRFVMAKEAAISAVGVIKNELITKGAEFVLMCGKDRIVIGTTAAVQDAEDWSNRDFGRPRRNAKQGMLPPKLARMMLNMSGHRVAGATVLDPFCGSGTVLMEAAMLGAKKLIGSDIATGAIHDTQHNMSWLKTLGVAVGEVDCFAAKASEVANRIEENTVDLVVTETYLGLPRRGAETETDLEKAVDYIETMYRESFSSMRKSLKEDAGILIAAPVHYLGNKTFEAPVEKIFEELGYWSEPLAAEPLIYHREEQLVGRRFFRFRKNAPNQTSR